MRFKRLEDLGGRRGEGDVWHIPFSLPTGASGMSFRTCPFEDCAPRLFQLGELADDAPRIKRRRPKARRIPGTAGMTCPYCGLDGADDDFIDERDIDAMMQELEWAVTEDAADHIFGGIRPFRTPSGGLVSIELKAERNPRQRPGRFVHREDLLRDVHCNVCARRYGVYAIGLHCPDCGSANLGCHFEREVVLVTRQVDLAADAREARDPELAFRLLGNAHEDVVTALETYLKTTYRHMVKQNPTEGSERPLGNTFQNIEKTQRRFAPLGMDPFSVLAADDLDTLRVNIEKRHVVGHNLGVADEKYAEVVQDERIGETVELLSEQVLGFVDLTKRVVRQLDSNLGDLIKAGGSKRRSGEAG